VPEIRSRPYRPNPKMACEPTPDHKCLSRRVFLASLSAAFFPFSVQRNGPDDLCIRISSEALVEGHKVLPRVYAPHSKVAEWIRKQADRSGHKVLGMLTEYDTTGHPVHALRAYLYRGVHPRTDCLVFEITPNAMRAILTKDRHVPPPLR
jgi:hypothetical protein